MVFRYAFILLIFVLVACESDSSSAPENEGPLSSESSTVSSETLASSVSGEPSVSSNSLDLESSSSSSLNFFETESSSSEPDVIEEISSSSVALAIPCKTDSTDVCEYGSLLDERDGNTYKTVKIGEQWWMAENLNYVDSASTQSLVGRTWCFNYMQVYCDERGPIYTWAAAIDSVALATDSENPQVCGLDKSCLFKTPVRGICPQGWHLPSLAEWETLFAAVGDDRIGMMLKASEGWYHDGNGYDPFGFSVLPAGFQTSIRFSFSSQETANLWSSTEANEDYAYHVTLHYTNMYGPLDNNMKNYAMSIRCVKD